MTHAHRLPGAVGHRVARTHAQPGGRCAGSVCGGCVSRSGAQWQHRACAAGARGGGAGARRVLMRMRPACGSRPRRGSPSTPGAPPRRSLATRRSPVGNGRRARRRGLRGVGPGRAVSGARVLCAVEGPAQRKREHPPPFPSALSPQARPLAAA